MTGAGIEPSTNNTEVSYNTHVRDNKEKKQKNKRISFSYKAHYKVSSFQKYNKNVNDKFLKKRTRKNQK